MYPETPVGIIEAKADGIPDDVVERAVALAEADESWHYGKAPKGVAAAAVYAAYLETRPRAAPGAGRPTQSMVAERFDTNSVTLRERFHELPEVER